MRAYPGGSGDGHRVFVDFCMLVDVASVHFINIDGALEICSFGSAWYKPLQRLSGPSCYLQLP
jgi:hypothetical protein